ncbi:MAG: hypothetical protein ACK5M7_19585 [Draconibacterium sp.]
MKTLLSVIILLVAFQLSAQENLKVSTSKMAINSAMQPAFVVEIPQAESTNAIKMWENRLVPKNLFDTFKRLPKMEKEGKDKWYIHGVVVSEICPDTLSIYTRITSLKNGIVFAALFETPSGFIGTGKGESELEQRASAYLRIHAVEVYKEAVENELDEQEKQLKKMEKEYAGYDKDNRKLDRKSSDSQSNLNILNGPQDLSSESSGLLSDEKGKEIKKEEKAVKKYSKKIDKNEDRQKKLAKEIDKKESEIKAVKQKLKNIK